MIGTPDDMRTAASLLPDMEGNGLQTAAWLENRCVPRVGHSEIKTLGSRLLSALSGPRRNARGDNRLWRFP